MLLLLTLLPFRKVIPMARSYLDKCRREDYVSPRNSLIAAQHDEEKPIKVGLIEIAAGGERFTSRLAL